MVALFRIFQVMSLVLVSLALLGAWFTKQMNHIPAGRVHQDHDDVHIMVNKVGCVYCIACGVCVFFLLVTVWILHFLTCDIVLWRRKFLLLLLQYYSQSVQQSD